MKKIVVGIAGRLASGKGTVCKYILETYHADKTRSSDPLRATLDIFSVPQTRESLDALSTFLRSTYGEDVIAKAMVKFLGQSPKEIVIFDGMRRLVDVEAIRAFEHSLFIFVDANKDIRYERSIKRNENVGDDTMTAEDFFAKDIDEPQQQIEALKEYADVVIHNDGSYEELMAQIHEHIDKALAPFATR